MERSTFGNPFIADVRSYPPLDCLLPRDQRVPDRKEGLVVVVDRLFAERRDLVRVPVALEVLVVLPDRGLTEVERVLLVAGQRPALGAEGHRPSGAGLPDLVPALRPKGMDVPIDVYDLELAVRGTVSHQAAPPTASILSAATTRRPDRPPPNLRGGRSRTHLGADRPGAFLGLAFLL